MTHTFLPWLRQGIANYASTPTNSGAYPHHATVEITATIKGGSQAAQIPQTFALAGPGEVAGILPDAIIRTEPPANNLDFEWNYLPFIEFYEEDFPWRYSPLMPDANNRLLPWLVLFVATSEEFEWVSKGQAVKLKETVLQTNPSDRWAWAHVQVLRNPSETPESVIKKAPERSLSRIICARKLEKLKSYEAFLVPAFERGRLAGLGELEQTSPQPAPDTASWQKGSEQIFPCYYHWSFSTGESGDVETLARKLKPNPVSNVAMPNLDIQLLARQLSVSPGTPALEMPILLQTEGKTWAAFTELATSNADKAVLNKFANWLNPNSSTSDRSAWTPVYGKGYDPQPPFLTNSAAWKHVLNLDPRFRVYANIGAEIVRRNQENFVKYAMDNATELKEANQRIRQVAIAAEIGKRLRDRHVLPLLNDSVGQYRAIGQTHALHIRAKSITDNNLAEELSKTRLVRATLEPAFRRITAKAKYRLPDIENSENLQKKMNESTPPGFNNVPFNTPKPEFAAGARYKKPLNEYYGSESKLSIPPNPNGTGLSKLAYWTSRVKFEDGLRPSVDLNSPVNTAPKTRIKEAIEPVSRLQIQINEEFQFADTAGPKEYQDNKFSPILFTVEFPHPVYNYLKEFASHLIQPQTADNSSLFPENSVSLLEINQAVVEAIMVGVNAEIIQELNFRGFPVDKSDTLFRNFWETFDAANIDQPEIKPIKEWGKTSKLGDASHREAAAARPEFLICLSGEIFRKIPDLNIYMRPAKSTAQGSPLPAEPDENAQPLYPILHGRFGPDIQFLGFDKTVDSLKKDAGYFLVFEQRPGSVRFGLDEKISVPTSQTAQTVNADDLAWDHFPNSNCIEPIAVFDKITETNPARKRNAATLAAILFQRPVQISMHLSALLPRRSASGTGISSGTITQVNVGQGGPLSGKILKKRR